MAWYDTGDCADADPAVYLNCQALYVNYLVPLQVAILLSTLFTGFIIALAYHYFSTTANGKDRRGLRWSVMFVVGCEVGSATFHVCLHICTSVERHSIGSIYQHSSE